MNRKVNTTRRKKKNTGRGLIGALILTVLTVCLFGIMGKTIESCYASRSEIQKEAEEKHVNMSATPTVNTEATQAVRVVAVRTPSTTQSKVTKAEPSGEKLTRTNGVCVTDWEGDVDYPQKMKDMLKCAQDNENEASLYLQLAELYECQNNLKAQDTGEGEITHIFNKWNDDLNEMDKLLYETYPFYKYTEHDVVRLASIIYAEAGSSFITDEHQRDVASVPLNRLLRADFVGKSLDEIIDADNQYPRTHNNRKYTNREWDNALYVLQHGPTTTGVYQANFVVSVATEVLKVYEYPAKYECPPTYICR